MAELTENFKDPLKKQSPHSQTCSLSIQRIKECASTSCMGLYSSNCFFIKREFL